MKEPQLFAYLGIRDDGTLELCGSIARLNPIGARLQKGSLFPNQVYEFVEDPRPENALPALDGMQKYFDNKERRLVASALARSLASDWTENPNNPCG